MIEVIGIAFCVALCFAVIAVVVITGLYGVVVWCDYIRPMIEEKTAIEIARDNMRE